MVKIKSTLLAMVLGLTSAFTGLEAKAQSTNVYLGPITSNINFAAKGLKEYLIQARSTENGRIEGNINEWVAEGTTNLNITAIPNPYSHFLGWTGDIATNTPSLTFSADKPYTNLNANFALNVTSNGTPEYWYSTFGRTNNFELADSSDLDEDGFTGRQEYIADTNPEDSAAFFYVYSGTNSEFKDQVEITSTSTNCNYDIWGCNDLVKSTWTSWSNFDGNGSAKIIDTSAYNFPSFINGRVSRINP